MKVNLVTIFFFNYTSDCPHPSCCPQPHHGTGSAMAIGHHSGAMEASRRDTNDGGKRGTTKRQPKPAGRHCCGRIHARHSHISHQPHFCPVDSSRRSSTPATRVGRTGLTTSWFDEGGKFGGGLAAAGGGVVAEAAAAARSTPARW
jgi:hypothetical protein